MQSDRSQHSRRSPDRNARERLNAVDACPVFPLSHDSERHTARRPLNAGIKKKMDSTKLFR
jgi:hypothetical protein